MLMVAVTFPLPTYNCSSENACGSLHIVRFIVVVVVVVVAVLAVGVVVVGVVAFVVVVEVRWMRP